MSNLCNCRPFFESYSWTICTVAVQQKEYKLGQALDEDLTLPVWNKSSFHSQPIYFILILHKYKQSGYICMYTGMYMYTISVHIHTHTYTVHSLFLCQLTSQFVLLAVILMLAIKMW